MTGRPFSSATPPVSVVMPVRNEVEAIEQALDSIRSQDYSGHVEIIVADAASTDGTRQLLDSDPDVIVVDNPDLTTPSGLNRAIERAEGEVVVRVDARSQLPSDYIRTAVDRLAETGADNVGGVQRAVGTSAVQRAIAFAMSSPIGVGDARFHYGGAPGPADTVYLGVFRRDVFDRVGLFDETLTRNQDYELNIRIRQAGGLVYFEPALEVVYQPRPSLRALWKQYFDYGSWKRIVIGMHPSSVRLRQLAPPLLIIGLLASAAMAVAGWGAASLLIPGSWVLTLLAASVGAVVRHRDPAGVLTGLAAGVMHLAWGLGFMAGPAAQLSISRR